MNKINKIAIKIGLVFLFIMLFQILAPQEGYAVISCSGSDCWYTACRQNSDCGTNGFVDEQFCQTNDLYQNYVTYTCNSPNSSSASCFSSKSPRLVQSCSQGCEAGLWYIGCSTKNKTNSANSATYNPHSYQRCVGNSVYWFDSYNNQKDLYQTCSSGQTCSGNNCVTNKPVITYNQKSVRGCLNNNVYWYDSLGNQQDLYQNCGASGQSCQDGQCVGNKIIIAQSTFVKNYRIKCYNNNVYWYDSNESVQSIYQNCSDNNQCTVDSCGDSQCKNELKCDGSTCAKSSEDYSKFCSGGESNQSGSNFTAAVSENTTGSFLKKWYIWPIILLTLIFLFIAIFKKLSSNN